MNKPIEDEDIYIKYLVSKHANIDLNNIIVVTRHFNTAFSKDFDLFVDIISKEVSNNPRTEIFFNHQSEGLQFAFIENMNILFNAVKEKCNISYNKFHLVSGAVNSPRLIKIYKNLCAENSWHEFPLWTDNFWETSNVPKIKDTFEMDLETKTKRILCYNGIPRIHRLASVLDMYRRNIIDKVYVSMNADQHAFDDAILIQMTRMLGANAKVYKEIWMNVKHHFPMKLTLADNIQNAYLINQDDMKLFKDTVASLVNETVFSSRDAHKYNFQDRLTHPCTFSTEKFWKTFQANHPFIVMSTPHYLKDIRHLGYRTFAPFIDESYDDVEDDELRFKMVMDEVEKICNMSDEQVYKFQQNVKPILKFNHALYKTKKPLFVRAL
jgi:hypothetical protein